MSGDRQRPAYPVEDFVQSLISQLDDVQDALALKVKTGRPLTWALKDVSLDLRVFLDVSKTGDITMRSAAPGEDGASSLHITLSTITKEMISENTYSFDEDEDQRGIEEFGESVGLDQAQRRRLQRLGVRTVGQLKRLGGADPGQILSQHTGVPANDLMRALMASSMPTVMGHRAELQDGEPVVRILGANLYSGVTPEVLLCGEPVEVLQAKASELVVRPLDHHEQGQVEILVGEERCTGFFRLPEQLRAYGRRGRRSASADRARGQQGDALPWRRDPWSGGGAQ